MQVGLPIFQSTCPVRGTTHIQAGEAATVRISIHVPRAGHDERRIIVLCLIEIFQSTCPMRGTTSVMYFWSLATLFQSTCPMRGTTRKSRAVMPQSIFQSTCPMRGTTKTAWAILCSFQFQSTCPMRGTTYCSRLMKKSGAFQSTCPMLGTTELGTTFTAMGSISIHVPHAGHDLCQRRSFFLLYISIHVPHAGHDLESMPLCRHFIFQSTCPMRGTTCSSKKLSKDNHFNPRAPCGARLKPVTKRVEVSIFQSTCPMRGTTREQGHAIDLSIFQSTCPMRGTTSAILISILDVSAFQSTCPMRGTTVSNHASRRSRYFNPRAPCGARRFTGLPARDAGQISIHVPHAGHDTVRKAEKDISDISIHVPHAGHDPLRYPQTCLFCNFNPRAPCGARLNDRPDDPDDDLFQSTCPMRGTTSVDTPTGSMLPISIHVPHAGHDIKPYSVPPYIRISIHVPHAGHDPH